MVNATGLNAVGSNLTNLYNYTLGGFRTLKPICAVRATTQTGITAGLDTQLIWDTVDINYDSMWSSGAQGLLTVNTPGVYRIALQGAHNGVSGWALSSYICINGTVPPSNAVGGIEVGTGTMAGCSAQVGLSIGAHIYGFLFQNTPSPVSVLTGYGGCRLVAEWISP